MSMEDNEIITCSWQQIEKVLSYSPKERPAEAIKNLLPWFRGRCTLFKNLDDESLSGVVTLAGLVRYKADSVIVHQGEFGNSFFIIVRGSVSVYAKKVEEKNEKDHVEAVLLDVTTVKGAKERLRFGQEICNLKPGRCIGELSVVGTHTERNATVISDEPCLLVTIERDIFTRFVSEKYADEIVRRISFISTHPLFRSWSPVYRNLLIENLRLRHFKFGDKFVKQGDNVDVVYFVSEGHVLLRMNPIKHRQQYKKLVSKVDQPVPDDDEEEVFDRFKEISVMERRKLRRQQGYYASEQRYRQLDICTVGSGEMIGDIEAILELPVYTVTAECIQELEIYEIDKTSFIRIIVKKNAETHEKMKHIVQEKICFRNNKFEGGIPIYNALLEYFQKPKPKDNRKKIIKNYLKKNENQVVNSDFLSRLSQRKNSNSTSVLERMNDESEEKNINQPDRKHQKQALWRNVGGFSAKMNISYKRVKSQQKANEPRGSKQFTAEEYKDLKKKMASLGKSTRKGGWSK